MSHLDPKRLLIEAIALEDNAVWESLILQQRLDDISAALVIAQREAEAASAARDEAARRVRELMKLLPPEEAAAIRRAAHEPADHIEEFFEDNPFFTILSSPAPTKH